MLRRILQIPWTDTVSTINVLLWAGVEKQLLETVRKMQISFLGHHIYRKGYFGRAGMPGRVHDKSDRERRRLSSLVWRYIVVPQNSETWVYSFPLMYKDKIFPTKCVLIPEFAFKIRVLKFQFCCNSMVSQPLPNFKTRFSPKRRIW